MPVMSSGSRSVRSASGLSMIRQWFTALNRKVNRSWLQLTSVSGSFGGRMTRMAETLSGVIERVTFHNPDNGFAVLRVQARGRSGLVTVVGHLPNALAGEYV